VAIVWIIRQSLLDKCRNNTKIRHKISSQSRHFSSSLRCLQTLFRLNCTEFSEHLISSPWNGLFNYGSECLRQCYRSVGGPGWSQADPLLVYCNTTIYLKVPTMTDVVVTSLYEHLYFQYVNVLVSRKLPLCEHFQFVSAEILLHCWKLMIIDSRFKHEYRFLHSQRES
jgi:hypothetical protein